MNPRKSQEFAAVEGQNVERDGTLAILWGSRLMADHLASFGSAPGSGTILVMSDRKIALDVMKVAQQRRTECRISVNIQFACIGASFCSAVGAAICAFADYEIADKLFSIGVLFFLMIEATCYGMTHWREKNDLANRYDNLIERAKRVAAGEPGISAHELREEQDRLESPHLLPFIAGWAAWRTARNWNAKGSAPTPAIFDSRSGCDETDFTFHNSELWPKRANPIKGEGTCTIDDNVISIRRANTGGRIRIQLKNYLYGGERQEFLPSNIHLSGPRWLNLSFEAKAPEGTHEIEVQIKNKASMEALAKQRFAVRDAKWQRFSGRYKLPATVDLDVFLDDHNIGERPGTIQIRYLLLKEL